MFGVQCPLRAAAAAAAAAAPDGQRGAVSAGPDVAMPGDVTSPVNYPLVAGTTTPSAFASRPTDTICGDDSD